jgi:DNA repair protein RecO (recombination protein O)
MDWEAPGIVLETRPFGESDAIATVMTVEHGAHRGLARGAQSRQAALWQVGNLLQLRWVGRLSDQLGHFSAEPVHATAGFIMDDRLALAMLTSCCAVAAGALPEREAHASVFDGLLRLLTMLPHGSRQLGALIGWEADLLAALGYGLDLSSCAVTGAADDLAFVSPRSGRAVSAAAAGQWRDRLLPLPRLLLPGLRPNAEEDDPAEWRDGLRVTGHFLARDPFGLRHLPLPSPRIALYDLVLGMTEPDSDDA